MSPAPTEVAKHHACKDRSAPGQSTQTRTLGCGQVPSICLFLLGQLGSSLGLRPTGGTSLEASGAGGVRWAPGSRWACPVESRLGAGARWALSEPFVHAWLILGMNFQPFTQGGDKEGSTGPRGHRAERRGRAHPQRLQLSRRWWGSRGKSHWSPWVRGDQGSGGERSPLAQPTW